MSGILTISGGRKYVLSTTSPTIIGSRGCAILLSAPGVEAQHARMMPFGGGFLVEPIMGGVLVNGSAVSASMPLKYGDMISIGSQVFTYSGPSSTTLVPPLSLPPIKASSVSKKAALKTALLKLPIFRKASPTLEGKIIVLDGPHMEGPDIDWAGLFLRSTFGLVLLPFICWQPALIMPFFLYGMANRNRQVPARYLRIEDAAGKHFNVKMKGDPIRGMVSQGDNVSIWGHWEGGSLVMEHARNQTTSSDVLLKPAVQRRTNRIILFTIAASIALIWLTAVIS
jgi:hypothetical protein